MLKTLLWYLTPRFLRSPFPQDWPPAAQRRAARWVHNISIEAERKAERTRMEDRDRALAKARHAREHQASMARLKSRLEKRGKF